MSVRWPFETLGDSNAPPLIFLHGFLGNRQDWFPVARVFSQEHFCILPDLPGHGDNTEYSPEIPLTFDLLSDGLRQLILDLQIDRPVLIGYSLGGRTALHFACTDSSRLRGLVLESTSPGIADHNAQTARAAVDDERADAIREQGLPDFLAAWYSAGLWHSLTAHPEKRAALISQRGTGRPDLLARAIADLSPGRMPSRWGDLVNLTLPVLLLAGELDEKYTAIIRKAAGSIRESRSVIVEDAGHNIHLERPEAFIHALSQFLHSLP